MNDARLAGRWQEQGEEWWRVQVGTFRADVYEVRNPDPRDRWRAKTYRVRSGGTPELVAAAFYPTLEEAQAACEEAFRSYRLSARREAEAVGFEVREPSE
jgi:hypothetical protein